MATKSKKKSQNKQKRSKSIPTQTLWRETISEFSAGTTDSIFTQFCLTMCYYLFTQTDAAKNYFYSPYHMYWICYFIHVNILNSYIWGSTFRNSVIYIYQTKSSQSIFRTIIIVLCQYLSIFIGVWFSIKFIEYIYADNPSLSLELKYLYVGKYDFPKTLNYGQYFEFIWQSLLFQLADRFVNGVIVTITPVLKRKSMIFDGSWMQVTFRCFVMHYLIVHDRMSVIVNPNYGFYACLYYWRWSKFDWIILLLPYVAILIWKFTFSNLSFLHNPAYFRASRLKKKKKKKQ